MLMSPFWVKLGCQVFWMIPHKQYGVKLCLPSVVLYVYLATMGSNCVAIGWHWVTSAVSRKMGDIWVNYPFNLYY